MKRSHLILINLLFVAFVGLSAAVVYQYITGERSFGALIDIFAKKPEQITTNQCTQAAAIDLSTAKAAPLQKLAVYQTACHSKVTDTVMVFFSMPATLEDAETYAAEDAVTLKDFAEHSIRPLVIIEPTQRDGTQIDYADVASGQKNNVLAAYFNALKTAGITDEQLGIWNPFPEPNLEYWVNSGPDYFAPAVNTYFGVLKSIFPAAHTSILLNSVTYSADDTSWQTNSESLLPYVKGLTKGSIEYVGLQGFPWMARQGGTGAILNAAEFIPPDLLSEIADFLGTTKVWFNTGTFGSKYTLDASQAVSLTPERRSAILATILDQAASLKDKGYEVYVNIFSEDKSQTAEETDWSYWSDDPFTSAATPVITKFISDATDKSVGFWLFDK